MAKFVKGDVVVVPFPFSDLTQSKRRPVLVLAVLKGDDDSMSNYQQQVRNVYSIPLDDSDFKSGSVKQKSNVRPNRIFTADKRIILYKIGQLNQETISHQKDR